MTGPTVRVTALSVGPAGADLFDERMTYGRIADVGAGEFVEVEQPWRDDAGKIAIDKDEWPALREAIDRLIGECREDTP